jgi:hypothetical protein
MAVTQYPLLIPIGNRRGLFGGYNVNGMQYQVEGGELGWHITSSPGRDPVNVYWVVGDKFYSVKVHIITEPSTEIRLEMFEEITFVPADEKAAIMTAISDWEA